jgi:hypothetical protein
MKKNYWGLALLACFCLLCNSASMAQVAEVKKFNQYAGKARLLGSRIEMYKNAYPSAIFQVEVLSGGEYVVKAIADFEAYPHFGRWESCGRIGGQRQRLSTGQGRFFWQQAGNTYKGQARNIFHHQNRYGAHH